MIGYVFQGLAKTNPDVELANEAVPVLGTALEVVPREEPVGCEGETDVC